MFNCFVVLSMLDQGLDEVISDFKGFSKILVYRVKREHRIPVWDTGCRSEDLNDLTEFSTSVCVCQIAVQ